MQISRKIENQRGILVLTVKASFADDELRIIKELGLNSYRVRTRDGLLAGLDTIPLNVKSAYRSQIGRVKGRWSTALAITSGFAIVDIASSITDFLGSRLARFLKIGVGRRRKLSHAMSGLTISSRRIERIKEAEFFIFFSLAAIYKAIEYAKEFGEEIVLEDADFISHLEGLDFAGAGGLVEEDIDLSKLTDAFKAH